MADAWYTSTVRRTGRNALGSWPVSLDFLYRMNTYKQRKEFVDDPTNWEFLGELPGIRLSELNYGGHAWYKIEVLRGRKTKYTVANVEKPVTAHYSVWVELEKCKYDPDANAFTSPITSAEIIAEIKAIDQQGRHTKKKETKEK